MLGSSGGLGSAAFEGPATGASAFNAWTSTLLPRLLKPIMLTHLEIDIVNVSAMTQIHRRLRHGVDDTLNR